MMTKSVQTNGKYRLLGVYELKKYEQISFLIVFQTDVNLQEENDELNRF